MGPVCHVLLNREIGIKALRAENTFAVLEQDFGKELDKLLGLGQVLEVVDVQVVGPGHVLYV